MESTIKAALLISDYKQKWLKDAAIQERQRYSTVAGINMFMPRLGGAAPCRATGAGCGELSLEPEALGLPQCGALTNYPFREAELITLAWVQTDIVSRAQATSSAWCCTMCRIDFCIHLIIYTMALLELDKHILLDNWQKCHRTKDAENIKILFVEYKNMYLLQL